MRSGLVFALLALTFALPAFGDEEMDYGSCYGRLLEAELDFELGKKKHDDTRFVDRLFVEHYVKAVEWLIGTLWPVDQQRLVAATQGHAGAVAALARTLRSRLDLALQCLPFHQKNAWGHSPGRVATCASTGAGDGARISIETSTKKPHLVVRLGLVWGEDHLDPTQPSGSSLELELGTGREAQDILNFRRSFEFPDYNTYMRDIAKVPPECFKRRLPWEKKRAATVDDHFRTVKEAPQAGLSGVSGRRPDAHFDEPARLKSPPGGTQKPL